MNTSTAVFWLDTTLAAHLGSDSKMLRRRSFYIFKVTSLGPMFLRLWTNPPKVPIWGNLGIYSQLGVSKNNSTLKSWILIGFSIINHPFWGTPIFGNIQLIIILQLKNYGRKWKIIKKNAKPCGDGVSPDFAGYRCCSSHGRELDINSWLVGKRVK